MALIDALVLAILTAHLLRHPYRSLQHSRPRFSHLLSHPRPLGLRIFRPALSRTIYSALAFVVPRWSFGRSSQTLRPAGYRLLASLISPAHLGSVG
jgi:hypothetical protein